MTHQSYYLIPDTCLIQNTIELDSVAHAFNPSTLGGRGRRISEFETSLLSSRVARATQESHLIKPKGKMQLKTYI